MENQVKTPDPQHRLTAWELLCQSWHFINEHEVITRASAIAFSAMMAAVPFLAMLLTIIVQLLPDMSPGKSGTGIGALTLEQLQQALQSMFPAEAFEIIQDQIARIQSQPPVAVISISVAITLWCASSVFMGVIDALNRIYGVVETRPYWRLRLRAMWMTIVQMVIFAAALVAIIMWPFLAAKLQLDLDSWTWGGGIRWLVVIVTVMLSFALSFHVGPDGPQKHRWVTPGSVIGTFFFLLACYGVKVYVQNLGHYDRTYGSLGGVMTLLLFFYISSLVLLLAAEINRLAGYAWKRVSEINESIPSTSPLCEHKGSTGVSGALLRETHVDVQENAEQGTVQVTVKIRTTPVATQVSSGTGAAGSAADQKGTAVASNLNP